MSDKAKLTDAIRRLAGKTGEQYCIVCTVDSVDMAEKTCDLTPVNGDADLQSVRLMANNDVGFLIKPKIGSLVIASFLNDAVAYVSMYSEIDEIQLNGTAYGGLLKVAQVATKLNALEAFANTVITAKNLIAAAGLASPGIPVTNGTLATFLAGIPITPITPTTQNELINTTVKHGNGV